MIFVLWALLIAPLKKDGGQTRVRQERLFWKSVKFYTIFSAAVFFHRKSYKTMYLKDQQTGGHTSKPVRTFKNIENLSEKNTPYSCIHADIELQGR